MPRDKTICLIVAMDRNRAIGRSGDMPWHLPADLKHFKETTLGRPIIMGRKTFEAIGRALPGRQNIVVTRAGDYAAKGVERAPDLDTAISLASGGTVFVIGGGEIYEQAMPLADCLEVTEVDTRVQGADTWFPAIDLDHWQEVRRTRRSADAQNPFDVTFVCYRRQRSG